MAGGKRLGEVPGYVREVGLTQAFAYKSGGNGDGQMEYQGFAYPGTAKNTTGWAIKQFTYDSSNRMTDIQWAGGTDGFDSIWDSRTGYTYS